MSAWDGNPNPEIQSLRERLQVCEDQLAQAYRQVGRFRHVFEKSPLSICIIDRNGCIINLNQACLKLLGVAVEPEVIGESLCDFFESDSFSFETTLENLITLDGRDVCEARLRCRNGAIHHVQMTGVIRTGVTGKADGYEIYLLDTTDRKKAEESLRISEERYRTILENALVGIYMFQDGGRFGYVNPRLLEMLGYDGADEIVGRHFWEFVDPRDRDLVKKRGLQREKGEVHPRHYPFRIIKKNGGTVWIDMQATHVSFMGHNAVIGNFMDISPIKQAEIEIRHLSRKLIEAIEEERKSIAADLHDEFGQMLTALQLDMESIREAVSGDLKPGCDRVMAHIQHMANSIRDITSRLRPDLLDNLGLTPAMETHLEDFQRRFPRIDVDFQHVGLKRRLPARTEIVLYRIFQEGLNNIAKHARADHVEILLTSSHPMIMFTIRDNGVGFDIDDGVFSRGDAGHGIGLLTMKERAASLGGRFKISSTQGKGTMIRVELPVLPEP